MHQSLDHTPILAAFFGVRSINVLMQAVWTTFCSEKYSSAHFKDQIIPHGIICSH